MALTESDKKLAIEKMKELADLYIQNGSEGLMEGLEKTVGDMLGESGILDAIKSILGEGFDVKQIISDIFSGAQASDCGTRANKKCGAGKVTVKTVVEPTDPQNTDNPMQIFDKDSREKAKGILEKLGDLAEEAQKRGLLPEEIKVQQLEDTGKSIIEQVFSFVPNLAKDLLKDLGVNVSDADSIVEGLSESLDFFGVKDN